jgi:hypothetical protein
MPAALINRRTNAGEKFHRENAPRISRNATTGAGPSTSLRQYGPGCYDYDRSLSSSSHATRDKRQATRRLFCCSQLWTPGFGYGCLPPATPGPATCCLRRPLSCHSPRAAALMGNKDGTATTNKRMPPPESLPQLGSARAAAVAWVPQPQRAAAISICACCGIEV